MSTWSKKPCARCGNKKGKNQTNKKYCYRCGLIVKREQSKGAHARAIYQRYGITSEQYNRLYQWQDGRCFICQRATGATRRLSVDHDHATGKVRGLLCRPCNDMLGHARDNISFFQRAIDYLNDPPFDHI